MGRNRYTTKNLCYVKIEIQQESNPDAAIDAKISQYELAYRMQNSVPEVVDFSDEPEHVLKMYGEDVQTPGSYAANCLLARRLAEKDVRFIQLYHQGWDQHSNLVKSITRQCKETDQPTDTV